MKPYVTPDEIKELHERVLYPAVRVKPEKAGGSGTVIYSRVNPENPDDYETFVLTNHHVVEGAISTKEAWDSVLKKQTKKEYMAPVSVELFDYVYESTVDSSKAYKADVVAYDQAHDMAIVKLDSPRKVDNIAILLAKGKAREVKLFSNVWLCGCSLLHDPFASPGTITCLREIIENKDYMMANAPSIFGNSGGAVYLAETKEFLGMPSRITTMQLGFGIDVLTFMGFFTHPKRLYEFLDEQEFKFIYDPTDTYKACIERRERKKKQAVREQLREEGDRGEPIPID